MPAWAHYNRRDVLLAGSVGQRKRLTRQYLGPRGRLYVTYPTAIKNVVCVVNVVLQIKARTNGSHALRLLPYSCILTRAYSSPQHKRQQRSPLFFRVSVFRFHRTSLCTASALHQDPAAKRGGRQRYRDRQAALHGAPINCASTPQSRATSQSSALSMCTLEQDR